MKSLLSSRSILIGDAFASLASVGRGMGGTSTWEFPIGWISSSSSSAISTVSYNASSAASSSIVFIIVPGAAS